MGEGVSLFDIAQYGIPGALVLMLIYIIIENCFKKSSER
jgi:hypothetical protein